MSIFPSNTFGVATGPNTTGLAGITSGAAALTGLLVATPQTVVGYQPQNPTVNNINPPQGIVAGINQSINTFVGNVVPSSISSFLGLAANNSPAIVFNYEGDNISRLQSDITDHYTEENLPVQDQIAIKPVTVTATGYIGELNDIPPNAALAALQAIANKLTNVSGYLPSLSTTALIAYNEAAFAYATASNLLNTAVSTIQTLTGDTAGSDTIINGTGLTPGANQNKQQTIYQQFYGYWLNRNLFTIQTPWAVFNDMAIESITATQSAETRMISSFEVTFKQIRYVSYLTPTGVTNAANTQNQLKAQSSLPTNAAPSTPIHVPISQANTTTIVGSQTNGNIA